MFKLMSRYSLVLGRPPSISDSYTDAMAPSNVELSDFDPVTGSTSLYLDITDNSNASPTSNVRMHFLHLPYPP